jgi:subtilisin family serine protease
VRRTALLPVLVLAFALIGVPASAATAAPPVIGRPDTASHTVTLITGDRVTLLPDGQVRVVPGAGRSRVPMLTSTIGGHVRVVPADALPMLNAGRLDARLFDITGLVDAGYDDRRSDLPLIVSDTSGQIPGSVVRRLPSLHGAAMHTPKSAIAALWSGLTSRPAALGKSGLGTPGLGTSGLGTSGKVWLDGKVKAATVPDGVSQIGAPAAWQAGYTGRGVTVAVLDSGVDVTHPDLAGKVAAQVDFSPIATGGTPTSVDVHDVNGHGTEVASVVGGATVGVAPGTRLVSGKMCDFECSDSSIIAAMEWAAADQHARIANLSFGDTDTPGTDPLEDAVNTLSAEYGTLFVIAAGNDARDTLGHSAGTLDTPGTADAALTVGAVDQDDRVASFSSRGPRLGDDAIKPDVTAPGVLIPGALSSDAGGDADHRFDTASGTSLSTPHVAGAAAILAQRHPDWTGPMLKQALMGSARPSSTAGVFDQGAGRVNIPAALGDNVLADPPSVSFGPQQWPHTDDTPIVRTVTYRNTTVRPVTLRFSLNTTAPAGMFRLSTSSLTIGAGASGHVLITADTRAGSADGAFTGTLTATNGRVSIRTPYAVVREAEQHTLTVRHVNRAGDAAGAYDFDTQVIGLDNDYAFESGYGYTDGSNDGTLTLRVPTGRYAIVSEIDDRTDTGWKLSVLTQPSITIAADRTVTLDARAARPVAVTVPDPAVTSAGYVADLAIKAPTGWVTDEFTAYDDTTLYTARIGAAGDPAEFSATVGATLTSADATSTYQLAWNSRGTLPTGLTRRVPAGALATVHSTYRNQGSIGETTLTTVPVVPGIPAPADGIQIPPAATQWFNADGGLRWKQRLDEQLPDPWWGFATTTNEPAVYRPGTTYALNWDAPVLSPCLYEGGDWRFLDPEMDGQTKPFTWGVAWTADGLTAHIPTRCDADGHPGWSDSDTGTTTLSHNGTVLRQVSTPGRATFATTPARGTYKLTVDTTANPDLSLSTHTTVTWTFTAPKAADGRPLPLQTVRLTAPDTASPGAAVAIGMTVETQPGATASPTRALSLDASYDDGATWHPAKITAGVAHLEIPTHAADISLRARTTNATHTTVEQTVIHAVRVS